MDHSVKCLEKCLSTHLSQLGMGCHMFEWRLLSLNSQVLCCLVGVHGACKSKAKVQVSVDYLENITTDKPSLSSSQEPAFPKYHLFAFVSVLSVLTKTILDWIVFLQDIVPFHL